MSFSSVFELRRSFWCQKLRLDNLISEQVSKNLLEFNLSVKTSLAKIDELLNRESVFFKKFKKMEIQTKS